MKKKAALLALAPASIAVVLFAAPSPASAAASLTISPNTGLKNGQTVTVKGTGFAPGAIFISQCSGLTGAAACDTTHLGNATANGAGAFTATFTVRTGTIGNGSCNAGSTCYLGASDAAQTTSSSGTIKFASASTPSTSSPSPSSSVSGTGSSTSAPAVAAGSGGGADRNGTSLLVILLAAAGGIALVGGGVRLARR